MQTENELAPGVPKARTYTDCTGRAIEFVHDVHEMRGMGFHISAIESGGSPGYEFKSAVCASPYIAYLDVHEKIQAELKQKYLVPADGDINLLSNELAGRVGYGGIVVDGKRITFEQLTKLLETYEGWEFSLKLG